MSDCQNSEIIRLLLLQLLFPTVLQKYRHYYLWEATKSVNGKYNK